MNAEERSDALLKLVERGVLALESLARRTQNGSSNSIINDTQQSVHGIPLCPNCSKPMVLRKNKIDPTNQFWGCRDYPECKATRNIDGTETKRKPKNLVVVTDEETPF